MLQKYYPVNRLRNVALRQVQTAYAFLTDIDFLPMHGLYDYLVESAKKHDLAKQRKVSARSPPQDVRLELSGGLEQTALCWLSFKPSRRPTSVRDARSAIAGARAFFVHAHDAPACEAPRVCVCTHTARTFAYRL